MSSGSLTDALLETLELFEEAGPPLTTNEVSERLDLGRRSTYDRLERLVDHGELETKKVGANARVWWRPATARTTSPTRRVADGDRDHDAEQLALLVEAVEEYAIFMLEPDGRVRTWNHGAERIKGYEREEILGEHFSTFYTEEDREAEVPEGNLEDAAADGVVTDEGWRVRADGSRFWAYVTITAIYDEDDALAGFAKVTRDMTDRRERERAVRNERNVLDRILETSQTGIGVFRPDGSVDRMNARMAELLWLPGDDAEEYELGELEILDPAGDRLDFPETPVGRALEMGDPVADQEVRIEDPDHGARWLSVDAAPLTDGSDEVERVVTTATDVTQRRERARHLERQRDDLVAEVDEMYERIDDAFYALDDQFRFTYVNERAEELLRHDEGELLGESVWEVFPDARETPAWDTFHRSLSEQVSTSYEVYFEPLEFWVEANVYPSETGLSVYFRDVTERKEWERELERYETTVETVWDGVVSLDADDQFVSVNNAFCEMTGYTREEILGEHATTIMKESDYEAAGGLHEAVEAGERDIAVLEYDLVTADGESIPVEARFGPAELADGTTGGAGVIRDVTERKERERELERYETIVETMVDGVFVTAPDRTYAMVNDAYAEMTGYSREELIGSETSKVIGEEAAERGGEMAREILEGEREFGVWELTQQRADGGTNLVESRFKVMQRDGEYRGSVGVVRDISERMERERELERFERIVETVDDGVYLVDPAGRFTMVNEAYAEMTGYPREELVGMPVGEIVDEETVERARGYEEEMVEGGRETARFEADMQTADGGTVRGEGVFSIIEGDDGDRERVGVIRDVTERKERERELAEQRERYRGLVENAPVAIATYDAEGRLAYVNDVAADLVGADDADELVGEPAIEFIHLDDRPDSVERIRGVIEDREPAPPRETKILGLDGEVSYAILASAPITREGEPGGQVVLSDVTERKEREREIERQRNRLGALNDLNGVVRSITDAAIDQSTRGEIERAVCEGLASAESYEFAWIGEVDPDTKTMRLRTEAGVEGYLDDLVISVDPDDSRNEGPASLAVLTGQMQTVRDVLEDAPYERLHDYAREYGFRSSAAIPIVHEGVRYGVVNVYAERPDAFAGDEGEVVEHLGEIVGHAIASVERKRALTSDEVVELSFQVQGVFDAFDLPEADGRLTLDRAVPVGDGAYLEYGTATEDMLDVLDGLVETIPHWESVQLLGDSTAQGRVRFELRLEDPPVLSTVTALGGYVDRAVIEDGDYRMRIHLAPSADARALIDLVRETYPVAQLVSRRQIARESESPLPLTGMLAEHLTERQRSALEAAYYGGYFEWPRDVNGEDVADSLGVSAPTFHQHLRKAQQKLLEVVLDEAAVG